MMKTFRIATRASAMALAQSNAVRDALQARFPEHRFELATRQASADLDYKSRLGALGGKGGAFVQSMRDMISAGQADMAMHSLKDLPGNDEYYLNGAFAIGACLPRDDARDALVLRAGMGLGDVPAVIGTSSVRRRAFLRRLFPASDVVPFRGSADRRIERLDNGVPMEFNYGSSTPAIDALVLAKSGLERIDFGHRVSRVFSLEEMSPAIGQGIVVAEYATENAEVRALLAAIDDKVTAYCYKAERALLRTLDGHCDSPIGGLARIEGGKLMLTGVVISTDGRSMLTVTDDTSSAPPEDLGTRLGQRMNMLGAQQIIGESRYVD